MEPRAKLVQVNEPEPQSDFYLRAAADFRRYLPLKVVTFAWFVWVLGLGTYALAAVWSDWWPFPDLGMTGDSAGRVAMNCVMGSALGATLYSFRGFYWAVGPQSDTNPRYRYDPNWTFWYMARPIAGVVLGIAVYGAVRAGVASLGSQTDDSTAAASYFVVGFLAGFASTQFFRWLERMAARTFGQEE